ncbi:phosphoadenosine phosphosulfate reductase [Sedimentibacter acidaminivorans]|uniref:Phosphoadenosine phosphosulfate reductase n=1 Tax=Sedimentibacter acidaminivorans TaxID=913099 RepID=A0ABS4GC79_9FIRM|nr:phosphoadenosine phosphosulfate reductase family protein [Sedimentibacter acidaminivorans]MBP1925269.1 phosphoadenosine phosphosulfate reductase [Sedimentibacter acidaminivorans]
MIELLCPVCNVPMKTDRCIKEECNTKTVVSTTIYWCHECNIPVFNKFCDICGKEARYISTDIRPVFPEEKLLLAIILEKEDPLCFNNVSIWNGSNAYFINGQKLRLQINKLNKLPFTKIQKIKEKYDYYIDKVNRIYFNESINKFIEANKIRYNNINDEAVKFIQGYIDKYNIEDMLVSFSGGKDSTVTSHLVTKSLGTKKVLHIFGDTTLEFDKTYEYKDRFRKNEDTKGIQMITSKNREKNFEDLCKVIGPPSRVMRWCCTVFKTGTISRTISSAFRDKTNILTFYGIRKSESASRSKYERESDSPKITKQTVVSPIIDWIDFDVWLYIFTNKIDFNEAYKLGYTRVGCWCCPNNGGWSEFLSKVHMYDKYINWRNLLVDFAKQIEKPDPDEYVDSGNWKARQGGNGLEMAQKSMVFFEPCATEDNAFNYELQRPITEELYELFKPFGYVNKDLGNKRLGEVYIVDRKGNPVLILQGRLKNTHLKVTIKKKSIAKSRTLAIAERKIQCQLTKYQMCMSCKACESVCKHNAILIRELEDGQISYRIDDEKCVRCAECVSHFNAGCYMRKVLTIKRG